MTIECGKCGGSNTLPEGKKSMFCAFCGSSIEQPIEKIKLDENPLKVKPFITERKVEKWTETVPGFVSRGATRVSGGFIQTNRSQLDSGRFIADELEHHEKVLNKGGELRLSNKGIKSIKNITEWFTDSELESIRILDLSNNYISELNGIEKIKNVKVINLSNNSIKKFPNVKFLKLREINLSNNQLTSIQPLFFSSIIQTIILDNNSISELIVDKNNIQAIKLELLEKNNSNQWNQICISLKNNPIVSHEFFNEIASTISNISVDNLDRHPQIKYLANKVIRITEVPRPDYYKRDQQKEDGKKFIEDLHEFINNKKAINIIEVKIDQDISNCGFSKQNDSYVLKYTYPSEQVIIEAIKKKANYSGDIVSLMNEKAALMNSRSRKQIGIGIALAIYLIFCFWSYSYSLWLFYPQAFLIGIPVIILSLNSFFNKD